MKMEKALPIYVYLNAEGIDCTNGGISSRYKKLLCLCDEGFIDVDLDSPPENLVKVVRREFPFFGPAAYHIEPVARPDDGNIGWMMGGNYAASSDARFADLIDGVYGAVAIHDRQETSEEYDLLSR